MALKDPAFWLVDTRSVKTRIRIFPYSDRLFARNLTCFDIEKPQQFFKNTLS